jgi:S1-C subfamily serine protease
MDLPTPSPFAALSASLEAAVAAVSPRVVAVNGRGREPSSGLVWRTGLVVTAEEALEGEDDLAVVLADGTHVPAELVGRDPSTDVALLRAETGPAEAFTPAPVPTVGSLALLVGRGPHSPLALAGLVHETGPAWTSRRGGRIDALVRFAAMVPRRLEGGAAVAADGSLIGLAVAGPRRRALAIPAATVERAVSALEARGYVARGWLGLSLQTLGRGGGVSGAVVVGLDAGGPAEQAGFRIGDIVTTWDGEAISGVDGVARRLGPDAVGTTATIGILRGGEPETVTVVVGERPRA